MQTQLSLLIAIDDTLSQRLQETIQEANSFLPTVRVRHYPTTEELEKLLRTQRPSIVFLDVDHLDSAVEVGQTIRKLARGTQIIAFSRECSEDSLLRLMRSGVSEWLGYPFRVEDIRDALVRVTETLLASPPAWEHTGHIFSFLPAKPGSGASTLALNIAAALAQLSDSRVALLDFDLNHGILGFLLKLGAGPSICDAVEHSERMDDNLWSRMVAQVGQLDVLRSGSIRVGMPIESAQVSQLLSYAENHYPVTCVDLAGSMERYALDIMEHSAVVFQVCTTDMASLHLARLNLELMEGLGLRDRVRTIVNRASYHGGLTPEAVKEILNVDDFISVPNSYIDLQTALFEGKPLSPKSPVAVRVQELAATLLGVKTGQDSPEVERKGLTIPSLRSAFSAFRFRKDVGKPQPVERIFNLSAKHS